MKHIDFYPPRPSDWAPKMLSEEPTIDPTCRIVDSQIGRWTELQHETTLVESTFGDYSYTAGRAQIIYTDIGKFCSIASYVRINPGNHAMWRPSQAHFTYRRRMYGFDDRDDHEFFDWRRAHRCQIGHDVWIGHNAVIMPGVSVGTGAVIGSGAVVTKDVAPYQIVGGVPARPIRQRFPKQVAEQLLAIAWWNWDRPTLEARFQDFLDLDRFLGKYAH